MEWFHRTYHSRSLFIRPSWGDILQASSVNISAITARYFYFSVHKTFCSDFERALVQKYTLYQDERHRMLWLKRIHFTFIFNSRDLENILSTALNVRTYFYIVFFYKIDILLDFLLANILLFILIYLYYFIMNLRILRSIGLINRIRIFWQQKNSQ